jgi:acetyl-CoA C-acetyltransferase
VSYSNTASAFWLRRACSRTSTAVRRAKPTTQNIDRFEINESFAAHHFARALDVGDDRLNVRRPHRHGHPLGATGVVLIATLLDELERSDARLGVASICGGAGVAAAIVIERWA